MVPALPDLALAPSYASLTVAGPRAQNLVVMPLMATVGLPVNYPFGKSVILRKTAPFKLTLKAFETQYPSILKRAVLGLS